MADPSAYDASGIPIMRPRLGRRGTDRQLSKLLDQALGELSRAYCEFRHCEGPGTARHLATCSKCYAMRQVATVKVSLDARSSRRNG